MFLENTDDNLLLELELRSDVLKETIKNNISSRFWGGFKMGLLDKLKMNKTIIASDKVVIANKTIDAILSKFKDKEGFYNTLKEANRDIIFFAITNEDEDTALKLLELIEDIDKEDYRGLTYLTAACLGHKVKIIRELLRKGANPNHKSNPLLKALGRKNKNNPEILELFIKYGVNLKKDNHGNTIAETIQLFEDERLNNILDKSV